MCAKEGEAQRAKKRKRAAGIGVARCTRGDEVEEVERRDVLITGIDVHFQ